MGTIRDRIQHPVTCVRCLVEQEYTFMDRLMWCESCRETARGRASIWGWGAGTVIAVALAIWIWTVIQPSELVVGGWVATVVAGLWISSKVAREIAYGAMRFRNARAVEAVPPDQPES